MLGVSAVLSDLLGVEELSITVEDWDKNGCDCQDGQEDKDDG